MPKDTDPMRVLQAAVAILGMSRSRHHRQLARRQRPQGGAAHQPVRHGHLRAPPRAPGQGAGAAARRTLARRQLPLHAHRRAAEPGGDQGLRREPHALRRARAERLHLHHARRSSSTQSDMHSAVAGGVGALKGPLHGGAGEAVMRTLMEIGEVGQRRRVRREGAGREAPAHGHGPSRLQGRRPARGHPARAWPRRRAASRASSSGTRWR